MLTPTSHALRKPKKQVESTALNNVASYKLLQSRGRLKIILLKRSLVSRGFRLQYTGPRFSVWSNNLVSASQLREHTINKLKKEIDEGRILGPFTYKPISTLRISPIGLVPKSDGSFRLITHLSFPKGNSINDFIDDELCKVKYASLDNVLDMVYNLGPETLLGKIDIKSAFRLLIVNPADFDLLGIYFYLSRYNDFQVRSKVHYGYGYI